MQSNYKSLLDDPGPGAGVKDILPIPATDPTDAKPGEQTESVAPGDGPTFSHALATESQDNERLAQQDHDRDVLDLGWNEKKQDIAAPLIGGMDNEELWLLVRRFNKQIYDVRATPYPPPGNLDLNIADEEEFSPDKMRANIERLYMTVGVGMLAAVKHIARLRSWRETQRTGCFAAAYFIAWLFDFLALLLSAILLSLIAFPRTREILFPPAPVSLVDSKTGGVQKPKSGVLGSHDSATGAPENHKGEAVEQEASNFVSALAKTTVDAKEVASSGTQSAKHDKTKVPMETAMWTKMRPIMHTIGSVADTWERLANALSPIPLFPSEVYRLRLVAILLPILLGSSLFITPYILVKSTTFLIGFLFFGDPILSRTVAWLNRTIPGWQKLLQPRNTILKGVPTNAQLTLTLLRHGEANLAPLPPPPRITSPPPAEPASLTDAQLHATGSEPPLNATPAELDAAIAHDPSTAHQTGDSDIDAAKEHRHGKKGGKILGFFKGTTRGVVKTAVGTDTVRAKAGSGAARNRLGVIAPRDVVPVSGPVEFEARYEGHKGRVYLSTSGATVPVVVFGKGEGGKVAKIAGEEREDLKLVWSVPISDIKEMRKVGGYGWKAKLAVGWSMEREVKDGLVIKTGAGEEYRVTAVPLRDALFNRLVAMGGQKWEAW
ncbi:hypothetical protein VTI74DRAFT_11426 [Chaetomium olivicolor]